jgi:hypothetical protein
MALRIKKSLINTENQMREMVKKLPTPYKDKTRNPTLIVRTADAYQLAKLRTPTISAHKKTPYGFARGRFLQPSHIDYNAVRSA